jgi:MarR-like DNA-binding transcriptional regulator SgrR of sgrS sRNA
MSVLADDVHNHLIIQLLKSILDHDQLGYAQELAQCLGCHFVHRQALDAPHCSGWITYHSRARG